MDSISNFFAAIPNGITLTLNWASEIKDQSVVQISLFCQQRLEDIAQTQMWRDYGQPFYEQDIKPFYDQKIAVLDTFDLLAATTCLAAVVAIVYIASQILSLFAYLPLVVCAGAGVMIYVVNILNNKSIDHFNEEAWEQLEYFRNTAFNITLDNPEFDTLGEITGSLAGDKYKYINKHIKEQNRKTGFIGEKFSSVARKCRRC